MRIIRTRAAIVGACLALTLAACGDAGSDDEGRDVDAKENAADSFDDGTRMKEIAEDGKIVVGVKYDQPGLGFKGATDDVPTGLDVEIAKLLDRRPRHRSRPATTSSGRRRSPTTASPS